MHIHKIIRVGNAHAIILPEHFVRLAHIQIGERFFIESNTQSKTFFIKPIKLSFRPFLTPDFLKLMKSIERAEKSSTVLGQS